VRPVDSRSSVVRLLRDRSVDGSAPPIPSQPTLCVYSGMHLPVLSCDVANRLTGYCAVARHVQLL
jgi:hypothetical protein